MHNNKNYSKPAVSYLKNLLKIKRSEKLSTPPPPPQNKNIFPVTCNINYYISWLNQLEDGFKTFATRLECLSFFILLASLNGDSWLPHPYWVWSRAWTPKCTWEFPWRHPVSRTTWRLWHVCVMRLHPRAAMHGWLLL